MLNRGWTATRVLGFLMMVSHSAHGANLSLKLKNGAAMTVSLQLSPNVDSWQTTSENSYVGGGYRLSFDENSWRGRSDLSISLGRDDGQTFVVNNFQVTFELQSPNLFALWSPNSYPWAHQNYRALSTDSFADVTSPNSGIPYVLAATREGKNLLALGLMNQNRVIRVSGNPQPNGDYLIDFVPQTPLRLGNFNETLFTDTTPGDWFQVTQGYADWVDAHLNYQPFPISPACYSPMYDLWYWTFDNTSIEVYWESLVQAKDLGFESYLFDAGWESEPGDLFQWLDGALGNYSAPADKLPGFANFLQQVRQTLQMNVVLWMAPYAMGRQSVGYTQMKDAHILFRETDQRYKGGIETAPQTLALDTRFDENVNLCPRTPVTQSYIRSLFERVSATYSPDGYWLDFQDDIPFLCEAPHAHIHSFGTGFDDCQKEIGDTIQQQLHQPSVEMRFPVANLNNKRYANLWQSQDSPADYDAMRLCSLLMRPFSRGVVMGTDEMFWPPNTDDVTVAKFVATTILTGVPAISADFSAAPATQSAIVKAWLAFYKANREDLTQGTFRPIGDFVLPDQKIESARSAFIYLRSGRTTDVAIDGDAPTIYVANCTDSDLVSLKLADIGTGAYQEQVLDPYLTEISRTSVLSNNALQISLAVPQGGMLRLTTTTRPEIIDRSRLLSRILSGNSQTPDGQ